MLVLRRKESQSIAIGDDIELTIVAIQRGRVRLGISAPSNVSIRRSELATLLDGDLAVEKTDDAMLDRVNRNP